MWEKIMIRFCHLVHPFLRPIDERDNQRAMTASKCIFDMFSKDALKLRFYRIAATLSVFESLEF